MSSQLVDKKGRVWQERTVIVKKEVNGFGFTLSQEMPVFVDKVYPSSSAQRAGILEGDRIIKVNGTEVVGHKHNEVVDMIRDSSHVTLTIIGKMNGTKALPLQPQKTSADNSHGIEISGPRHLQEMTQQTLKSMLQKQRKTYEGLSVEFSKEPGDKLEKELRDCENIMKILEEELASKTPAIDLHVQTNSANMQMLTGKSRSPPQTQMEQLAKKLQSWGYSRDDVDLHDGPVSPRKQSSVAESPKPSRSHTFSNGTLFPNKIWRSSLKTTGEDSDDDLSDEVPSDGAGPFSSLQDLKNHPAHLAVFLHYLYLTKDPKHLLFYLVASSYQANLNNVELLKQRGLDIYWTFFIDQSPLPLDVEQGAKERILSMLESCDSVSKLKGVFAEVQESMKETIVNDLGNYRHKRVIGLAGMFNDHLLSNDMTKQKHIEVVLSTLGPDLKQLLDDKGNNGVAECLKNQAIAACMATFVLDLLGVIKSAGKSLSVLDRVQSFTKPDILTKKAARKKKLMIKGHSFQLMSFKTPTTCDQCGKFLWGVVYQGYQCSQCAINLHRYCCITELAAECAGQQKAWSKPRKASVLSRKPSAPNIFAVEEPDMGRLEGVGSADLNASRGEEEEDKQSPPSDALPSPNFEGSLDASEVPRRDRSTSDPHTNSLFLSDSEIMDIQKQAGAKDVKIKRTNSERLPSRPDSVERHPSSEGMAWSSEDSQIGKQGSLEAIAETPHSTSTKLPVVDEDNMKELLDDDIKDDPSAWAEIAPSELLEGMRRHEIQRQENIRELVYTERTHLYKLKVMRCMYKIPLQKQGILPPRDIEQLFPSLEELIVFHGGFCSQLKERVGPLHDGIVKNIADVLLQRFEAGAGDRLCNACSVFASNQPKAEKLLRGWKKRNERLRLFIKNQEAHPLSNRLTLSDLMPIAWNRLTRYKLLIDNIMRSYRKDWEHLDDAEKQECEKTETALTCVKRILAHVNKQVKFSNEQQKLLELQAKIEMVGMDKTQHPIAKMYRTLDLCARKRRLIYEGSLTWRLQHRKVLELHALLFNDILVLLEKHEDKDKYLYRCHNVENVSGSKEELSPVIRLQECLLRHAAADRGGRTFLLVNNSNLMKLAQMYEFIAESPNEKKQWEDSIKKAMLGTQDGSISPDLPASPLGDEVLGLSAMTMHLDPRAQLNKIDEDMKKLHEDKLRILRAMQRAKVDSVASQASLASTKDEDLTKEDDTSSKGIIWATIEQAGDITQAVSHIMVPNPTKTIIAETQHRLTNIIHELQKNLSRLLIMTGGQTFQDSVSSIPPLDLDLTSDSLSTAGESTLEPTTPSSGRISSASGTSQDNFVSPDLKSESEGGREVAGSTEILNIPSPIPEVDEALRDMSPEFSSPLSGEEDELGSGLPSAASMGSMDNDRGLTLIVAPPDRFSGDDESATPTPGMEGELTGNDSEASTPRLSDTHFMDGMVLASEGKVSPLVLAQTRANGKEELLSPPLRDAQTSGSNSPGSETRDKTREALQNSSTEGHRSSSPLTKNKKLSVFTSSEHSIQPSTVESTEDTIPSFSLCRRSTSNSINSDLGRDPKSPGYEGSDF